MEVRRILTDKPFFSVCIPQYNRTSFLVESCKSLSKQSIKNFEVCISDDQSTDGRRTELLDFLEQSDLSFVYRTQGVNSRYDANLRAAIELASGKFCFLLGNDDCLCSSTTLEELMADLRNLEGVGVAITNYEDFATGKPFRRIGRNGLLGRGPEVAVEHFRDLSFLSGVVLNRERARKNATSHWDGSEMYQMYIACRTLAQGDALLGVKRITVRKDIVLHGENVESYATRPRLKPCPIIERRVPLVEVGRLVSEAVGPYLPHVEKGRAIERVFRQLLFFTYPFWIFEYRRVQSWNFSAGFCLAMRLKNIARDLDLSPGLRLWLRFLHLSVTAAGLLVPVTLFNRLYPVFYRIAKFRRALL